MRCTGVVLTAAVIPVSCGRTGNRLTAFVINTTAGQLADLELRHRRRARCEDRIRNAKDTGIAEPAVEGLRAEQYLDRRRPAGDRADRVDADARLGRDRRPPLRTQTATPTAVLSRRDHRPPIPPRVAASVRSRPAPAPVHHRSGPPARPARTHLTSSNSHRPAPASRTGKWNPAPLR